MKLVSDYLCDVVNLGWWRRLRVQAIYSFRLQASMEVLCRAACLLQITSGWRWTHTPKKTLLLRLQLQTYVRIKTSPLNPTIRIIHCFFLQVFAHDHTPGRPSVGNINCWNHLTHWWVWPCKHPSELAESIRQDLEYDCGLKNATRLGLELYVPSPLRLTTCTLYMY